MGKFIKGKKKKRSECEDAECQKRKMAAGYFLSYRILEKPEAEVCRENCETLHGRQPAESEITKICVCTYGCTYVCTYICTSLFLAGKEFKMFLRLLLLFDNNKLECRIHCRCCCCCYLFILTAQHHYFGQFRLHLYTCRSTSSYV